MALGQPARRDLVSIATAKYVFLLNYAGNTMYVHAYAYMRKDAWRYLWTEPRMLRVSSSGLY